MERAELARAFDEGDNPYHTNSLITLYVHAGIAASDAICCHDLGEHSEGRNHTDAVRVLGQVQFKGSELSKALGVLLELKTEAGYGSKPLPHDRALRAQRSAEKLVQAARDRVTR
jgi:hypothetical protein